MTLSEVFVSHNIILTAILTFGLGVWTYLDRPKDSRYVTLGAILVTVALWVFSMFFWRRSLTDGQADFWIRISFSFGSFLPTFLLFFAYAFWRDRFLPAWAQFLAFLPNFTLVVAIFWPSVETCAVGSSSACLGSVRVVEQAIFVIAVIVAAVFLGLGIGKRPAAERRSLVAVAVGVALSFGLTFVTVFRFPLTAASLSFWFGVMAMMVGMFIVPGGMFANRVPVNLRLFGVEFFVIFSLAVIAADLVISDSLPNFALRLSIMVILVLFGVFSIRKTAREMRRMRRTNQMVDQVRDMNGRLLEADKVKTQLVSFASHQLRAPLGGLRSYLDMLLKGDFGELNPKQKEVVRTNLGALSRMAETVETFLNVAKAESDSLSLYRSETDLNALAKQVVLDFRSVAERKGLKLILESPERSLTVSCDQGKVYHVFSNLIDNAIKYTDSGQVKVSLWNLGDKVRVEVSDTGFGLSRDEQVDLFRIFRRGLVGISVNDSGSGLGLYIIKKIVLAHGGQVSVESPGRGKGSTFGFTLPLGERSPVVLASV